MSQSKDSNIKDSGINKHGNHWTKFKDGQYAYENYAKGTKSSFYHNGGSSKINNYHNLAKNYSWYENHNTGDTNRPTKPEQNFKNTTQNDAKRRGEKSVQECKMEK